MPPDLLISLYFKTLCRPHDWIDRDLFCVCVCLSHITQLTPQQQSAEPRNSAGAEALAVVIRPKEASRVPSFYVLQVSDQDDSLSLLLLPNQASLFLEGFKLFRSKSSSLENTRSKLANPVELTV